MAVSAQQVKELRQRCSAGILDCRKALDACKGDLEAAVGWLRKKGLSDASRKAGRIAADGLVGVVLRGSAAAVVEVNSETDFVARSPAFQELVLQVASTALSAGPDIQTISGAAVSGDGATTVAERIQEAISTIGENIAFRRAAVLHAPGGRIASYVHNSVAPGLGKIGVLVALACEDGESSVLEELGHQIAMHVAASQPLAVSESDIDSTVLDKEREILTEQAVASGKPAAVIQRMVDGRMKKFLKESCLLQQPFVVDPEITVAQAVEQGAAKCGAPVSVVQFKRFAVGEGIEKRQEDFASEVASVSGA